jgi:hypothetical protein
VEARYVVYGRRIGLALGKHRRDLPLVIDPVMDFSYVVNGNEQDFGWPHGCEVRSRRRERRAGNVGQYEV